MLSVLWRQGESAGRSCYKFICLTKKKQARLLFLLLCSLGLHQPAATLPPPTSHLDTPHSPTPHHHERPDALTPLSLHMAARGFQVSSSNLM